jgi:small-conductance mechanosensitive channel/CRP-like cAMP-binding protein
LVKVLKRLLAPVVAVAIFAALVMVAPALMHAAGEGPAARLGRVAAYVIQVGLWLSLAFLLIRLLDVLFWDRIFGRLRGREVPRLLKDSVAILVVLIAGGGILAFVFDQSVTGVWATSGALGIVIGLALRSIILDIFSGLAIDVDQSYRIGDYVELLDRTLGEPIYGRVVEINWRTTRIETDDRRIVVVPNSKMGLTVLGNYSLPSEVTRFETVYTLDFTVPAERALRVLLAGAKAAAGRNGLVADPQPTVIIGGPADQGVEYRVRFWNRVSVMPPRMAKHHVNQSVLKHLASAGLSLALPKLDAFTAPMPSRQLQHEDAGDRARLLAGVDMFAWSLTPDEFAQLAGAMTIRSFPAGAVLMHEGESGATMVILAEGLLEALLHRDGKEVTLGRIEPGEFAGEMSLLTGEPRSATIVALTDAVAYEITREHLAELLAERPAIAAAISKTVAERRLNAPSRLAEAGNAPEAVQVRNFSNQILQKMRFFFRHASERGAAHTGRS